jgi:hypothetical protein
MRSVAFLNHRPLAVKKKYEDWSDGPVFDELPVSDPVRA